MQSRIEFLLTLHGEVCGMLPSEHVFWYVLLLSVHLLAVTLRIPCRLSDQQLTSYHSLALSTKHCQRSMLKWPMPVLHLHECRSIPDRKPYDTARLVMTNICCTAMHNTQF